ncbi:hypothetical protein F2P56_005978 [Juglans regia]|uniref:E3 ubiquitin-protein ligase RMA n=2 Tax=Juglans regia TaxID=51240 RepID=A0A833XZG5_JUGRE|nr:uncharacterized protein LOC109011943 [Juglans regia]KAF5474036.1 hypothetical protein F2P56_005977 [Juglans regia]KAF5474037.1 hypothetical protein F2P56_005978 [Juglans regia]
MSEETSDTMNLDLNLGPIPEPQSGSVPNEPLNLDDWVEDPSGRLREAIRLRARQRWRRWRPVHIPPEAQNISLELNQLMVNSGDRSTLQTGEGSGPAEERINEIPKTCENNNGILENEISEKNVDVEKGSGNDGSFFDCNICLDLARNPVVTCCGHLFCWACLYRWLHVHSDAKECPVCKGEVTIKSVTPIYGRGNNIHETEEDSSLKIPHRPHARRIESLRQTLHRTAFFPVEEMIRRLGGRFDLSRDFIQPPEPDSTRETVDRTSLLSRILTSRARREQNSVAPDVVDLTQSDMSSPEIGENRQVQSLLLRRSQSHRTSLHSALSSAERLVDAFFRNHPVGRNQEQPQPVDDRDSFSSIAAGINSESQVDTAMEIDSMVSLSTSSSRRRNDVSRGSDVDSGDSRAHRRRRLH